MKDTKKPSILFLGPLPPPYMGPAIATQIILKSSLKEDFALLHLNTNTHSSIATLGALSAGRLKTNLFLHAKMIRMIIKHQPALVVIPISQTTVGFIKDSIYILISRMFLKKTLLQLRGSNFTNWLNASSRLMNFYVSFILHLSEAVIVLGEKLRSLFTCYFPLDRIFVVPNGGDYSIQPSFDTRRRSDAEHIKVLYFGNLMASKGIEDVVQAAAHMRDHLGIEGFQFHIAGDWFSDGIKENLLKKVRELNLPLIFHGTTIDNDKWLLFSEADIFLFPPREPEGHPWVIIEAMAAGLPIISTDQGAITESVMDGINGFIIEKCNPTQIAEKCKFLIEHPEIKIAMGKQSRRIYLERFTEAKMIAKLSRALNIVLQDC